MKSTLATILIGLALCVSAVGQVCQESPPNARENAALTSLRVKLRTPRFDHAVQGVVLSGCNGHDYILVMLYAHPSNDVLKHIPKKYHGLPVVVKVWDEHPRID